MSRNLCRTDCYRCGEDVLLDEKPRPITRSEAFCYFDEYERMLVANATCPVCGARYLAWCDDTSRLRGPRVPDRWAGTSLGAHLAAPRYDPALTHFDLSFRSSFNDEPGDGDLPPWVCSKNVGPRVLAALERLTAWAVRAETLDAEGKAALDNAKALLRELGRRP
jgi:hypothetical protein